MIHPQVVGDPHMIGLLGQKIDWVGEDGAWYCLISNGPDFHVNVRLSAPMPVEYPTRQLVSAVNIITDDGLHSLLVEVKDPYTTVTEGCPALASPCLADGGLRIMVDGKDSATLQSPTENVLLSEGGAGSSNVVVSTANLPAECRPFGGDRIWAAQFAEISRNLRIGDVSFADWLLQPKTLAAPTWCALYLQEGGTAGLLATRSEHATFRVETPVAVVRVNVGVNYQDLETALDGTTVLPRLEFWQMDLGFDELQLSDDVTGLLGDTSKFVLDDEGVPVTSGLGAPHAPVESYPVADAYARDFEKLHRQQNTCARQGTSSAELSSTPLKTEMQSQYADLVDISTAGRATSAEWSPARLSLGSALNMQEEVRLSTVGRINVWCGCIFHSSHRGENGVDSYN